MNKQMTTLIFIVCAVNICFNAQKIAAQVNQQEMDELCEALEDLKLDDTYISSASIEPANGDLPEHCRVIGHILPAINFEIRMPTKNWKGKFLMEGCGGFCGNVGFGKSSKMALKRNYAVSYMDAGHWGENVGDGRWAHHNRQAEIDWAYRAVHRTAHVTKVVIWKFYGRAPEKSYFQGCSTGGRMAVMAALRYPEDFDGIISNAPAINNSGLNVYGAWLDRFNRGPDGKDIISAADMKFITDAVYNACDSLDGLKDGLIADPRDCNFDPKSLLGGEGTGFLSAEKVEILKAWYQGPKNSLGERLYPGGLPLGSEPFWHRWIIGKTEDFNDNFLATISLDYFRYVGFQEDPGENYRLMDFDFDTDPQRLEYMAKIIDPDNPDLEKFRERKGKLLMYHGWADPIIPPWTSINYYEAVEKMVGNQTKTQEFFRLFMIPGMDHCGYGKELGITGNSIEPLTALEKWVEDGEAPDSLIMKKFTPDGSVMWTRPVYPYPLRTGYKGEGDVNSASSYERKEP